MSKRGYALTLDIQAWTTPEDYQALVERLIDAVMETDGVEGCGLGPTQQETDE